MPLDPALGAMLEMVAAAGAPALHEVDVPTGRAIYLQMTYGERAPEQVVPVASTEDRMLPGAKRQLHARVYRPEAADDAALPTVVFFHGGGWVIGDLNTHDNMARHICHHSQAVVVSVDYRLAPENPYPAAVEDAVFVTRWVSQNLAEFGCSSVCAVAGDSAGGNLSAIAAQAMHSEGVQLCAQFLIYPSVDLASDAYPSRRENAEGYFLEQKTMEWFVTKYLSEQDDPRHPHISPLRAASLAGLPPALIVTAEYDPLRDEGRAYAEALQQAGVAAELMPVAGMIHGFYDMGGVSPAAKQAIVQGCTRFGQMLR